MAKAPPCPRSCHWVISANWDPAHTHQRSWGSGGGGCPWQPLLHMCVELHFIRKKEDKEYKLIRILPIALRQL